MKIFTRIRVLMLLLAFSITIASFGQCQIKFKCWVDQTENSSVGDIYISLNEDPGAYTFQLYDVFQGKVIKEKVLKDLEVDENVLLFDKLASSTYIIYVSRDGCTDVRSIGGMGLVISSRK